MGLIETHDQYYLVGRKKYWRVTEVLSLIPRPGLDQWKERVGKDEAERVKEEAGEWGRLVHLVTYYHDMGRVGELDTLLKQHPELVPPWLAWLNWAEEIVVEMVEREKTVWSDRLQIGGTIDCVAVLLGDRKPSIIDIKSGRLKPEFGLQMALYKEMYNEKARRKAERRICVSLPRDNNGHLAVKEYKGIEDGKEALRWAREYVKMKK